MSGVTGQPVFHVALPVDSSGWSPPDYTASLVIKDRISARRETIAGAEAVRLRLRGVGLTTERHSDHRPDPSLALRMTDGHQVLHVTLMEDDGTSWSAAVPVDSSWSEPSIPLADFAIGRGVLLPEGFPGEWNYWVGPAEGRGGQPDRPRLEHLERLQLSLRRENGAAIPLDRYGVEVEWVTLEFGANRATAP
jgi:hypothetical protein